MNDLTPCKAIHQFCIDCCGGNRKGPKLCSLTECVLWPYRTGHNPKRRGKGGKNFSPNTTTAKRAKRAILLAIREGKIQTPDGEYMLVPIKGLNTRR